MSGELGDFEPGSCCEDELEAENASLTQQVERAREGLESVGEIRKRVLGYIERNGFVFTNIRHDPKSWEYLAFSIYSDLCLAESLARDTLDTLSGKEEG